MGWSFRKAFKLVPGVKLNVSKSGPSVSAGRRGATVSKSKRGTRVSLGIPGTGIRWTSKVGGRKQKK